MNGKNMQAVKPIGANRLWEMGGLTLDAFNRREHSTINERINMKRLNKISIAAPLIALLVACGGGGDDTTPTQPTTPTTSTGNPAAPSITSPSDPLGTVDAESLAAFSTVNEQREQCGFGRLNWNDALATVAKNHADWQIVNNVTSHSEVPGTQGFTGVTLSDRYIAAGFSGFVGGDEIAGFSGSNSKVGQGAKGIRGLLSAPYHALGLMHGFTDVGFAVRNATDVSSTHGPRVLVQVNLLYKTATGPQSPATSSDSDVRTYPCQGVAGTNYKLDDEQPNPTPSRNLRTNPIGHPVMIEAVSRTATLVITSATIAATGGSPLRLLPTLTKASDTNGGVKVNQAVVMPDLPMTPLTTYSVSITGTVNDKPFSRNFTFTTGSS